MLGMPAADHAHVLDLSDRLLGSLQGGSDDLAVAMEAFGEWTRRTRIA